MMIGIIIAAPVNLSPFAKKYLDALEEKNIPYEVVQWDRRGIIEDDRPNWYTCSELTERYGRLASKIKPFLNFRKFSEKIIKEKKYDKLIILTTQTAVMVADLLLKKKYKGKYFYDYRDTSYEYIGLYRRFINRIILNSYATCVSSPGFKKYLTDKKELFIAHNFQKEYYDGRVEKCASWDGERKIVIGYIGYLREFEYLKKFVDAFGSDERFEFHIHGCGDCEKELEEYAKKYENVKAFGEYAEEDKMKIVDSFDMICYNYPRSFVNYPAIANKFYDGMIRKKPMFGNSATFSGELIEKNGLGISLPEDEGAITEKIYGYFKSFDREAFEKNCEDFLKGVLEDDKKYTDKINEFLEG